MTELSLDDLDLLRAENCLIDLESATEAAYVEAGILAFAPWVEVPEIERRHWRGFTEAALRSQGLTPGAPSFPALRLAIRRRGWVPSLVALFIGQVWTATIAVPNGIGPDARFQVMADEPEMALALALCQAIRSLTQEDPTDG